MEPLVAGQYVLTPSSARHYDNHPPKSNRKDDIEYDFWRYKERHVVECLFGKLKHYRRVATRHEKKAINYLGMLSFASVLL